MTDASAIVRCARLARHALSPSGEREGSCERHFTDGPQSYVKSAAITPRIWCDLVTKLPVVLGGLGLAALGAKVDDAGTKPGGTRAARQK
jgi:hypothetical protein